LPFSSAIFGDTRIDTPKIIPLHLGIEPGTSETISTGFVVREIQVYIRDWLTAVCPVSDGTLRQAVAPRGDLKQQSPLRGVSRICTQLLEGEIEVDESYFGGHRKGKRGRGAAGK
jgi:hypothetical protein